jgi:hypothetical protein
MLEEPKNFEIIKSKECMVKQRKRKIRRKRGSLVRRQQDVMRTEVGRLIIMSAVIHHKSKQKLGCQEPDTGRNADYQIRCEGYTERMLENNFLRKL